MANKPNFTYRPFAGYAYCPVTGNATTRMTEESFRRLCAIHVREGSDHCQLICKGEKLPDGLEFIELEKTVIKEEDDMGSKPGICEICNEQKNLKSILGKRLCAMDEHIWRGVKNQPCRVLDCLIEASGRDFIFGYIGVDAGGTAPADNSDVDVVSVMSAELSMVKGDLERSEGDNDKLRAEIDQLVENKNSLYEQLVASRVSAARLQDTVAKELGRPIDDAQDIDIATEISILKQENDYLREQLKPGSMLAYSNCTENKVVTFQEGKVITRDTIVLDIALEVLDGKVTGVDAERLRALR